MRSRRAVPTTTTQLSFLVEPPVDARERARRKRAADRRPLSPAESLPYCNALLAEIDRVARLEDERVRRLAALYEAAVSVHGEREQERVRASGERATG